MSDRPNIFLIMTDQQRFDTIAALGNRLIRTPALDRLCAAGTAFTRAYTPVPVCVGARTAILTGMPPHLTGCVDNDRPDLRTFPSLMQRLSESGYQCHGVGKMHFGGDKTRLWGFESRDTSEEEPAHDDDYVAFLRREGFSHVIEPHGVRSEMYYVPQPSQLPARLHHTTWVADRSIEFLSRRDRRRPFFLFSSFVKPHPPFENPTPWNQLYRTWEMPESYVPGNAEEYHTYWNRCQNRYKYCDAGRDRFLERTRRAAYYGAISFIDFAIGRMIDALGSEVANTLILFTADHGELLGDFGCFGKRSMLDASVRVPLIAVMPGMFSPGLKCDTACSLLSIASTALGVAGVRDPVVSREGPDLHDIARGMDPGPVFSQYQRGRYALYMAVYGQTKFVRSSPDSRSWILKVDDFGRESIISTSGEDHDAGKMLDHALRRRFERDRYAHAVENGQWIDYQPVPWPEPGDAGLLRQDSRELLERFDALGPTYARPSVGGADPYRLLRTPEPFLKRKRPEIEVDLRPRERLQPTHD